MHIEFRWGNHSENRYMKSKKMEVNFDINLWEMGGELQGNIHPTSVTVIKIYAEGLFPQFKLCLLYLEYVKFYNVFAIFHVISQYFLNSDRYFLHLIPIFCTMNHF
jgi:hypothetical protein